MSGVNFDGYNPNDEEYEDIEEEDTPPPLPKNKADEPKTERTKSPRKASITVQTEELDDFLSEVSRLSAVIEDVSQKLEKIERSTAVVFKLQDIADMDLKAFKNKFEDMVNNLDLNSHAKAAVRDALKGVAEEHKQSNDLLKNLIFELEENRPKKQNKNLKNYIFGGLAILVLGGGYWLAPKIEPYLPKFEQTATTKKTVKITVRKGASVLDLETGKTFTVSSSRSTSAVLSEDGYHYIAQDGRYRVSILDADEVKK